MFRVVTMRNHLNKTYDIWIKLHDVNLTWLSNYVTDSGGRTYSVNITNIIARHWRRSWACSILRSISSRLILMLSAPLLLGLQSGLVPRGFPHQSSVCIPCLLILITWPAHISGSWLAATWKTGIHFPRVVVTLHSSPPGPDQLWGPQFPMQWIQGALSLEWSGKSTSAEAKKGRIFTPTSS